MFKAVFTVTCSTVTVTALLWAFSCTILSGGRTYFTLYSSCYRPAARYAKGRHFDAIRYSSSGITISGFVAISLFPVVVRCYSHLLTLSAGSVTVVENPMLAVGIVVISVILPEI